MRHADKKLSKTMAGKKLSPWFLRLINDQARPLAPQPLIRMAMPPLAFYIWQQLGHFGRKRTDHDGLTSLRAIRLPILLPALIPTLHKPITLSPVWQPLLNLTWFRRLRKQKGKLPDRLPFSKQKRLVNDASIKMDELYPVDIENSLSPPASILDLPYIIDDLFPHIDTISMPYPPSKVTHEPELEDAGEFRLNKIDNIDQTSEGSLAQVNWQPRLTDHTWYTDEAWLPFTERPVLSTMPITDKYHIINQSIRWAHHTPVWLSQFLMANDARFEPQGKVAQQPTLPYIADTADTITYDEEIIQEYYRHPIDFAIEDNLYYSLPGQIEPIGLGIAPKIPSKSGVKRRGSIDRLLPKLPKSIKEAALNLLTIRTTWDDTQETGKSKRPISTIIPLPLALQVKSLPGTPEQRAEAIGISIDLGSTPHVQATDTVAMPDNAGLGQGFQISQTESPSIYKQSPPFASLATKPSLVTGDVHYTPNFPDWPHVKSEDNIPLADRNENGKSLWNQYYEPSFQRYEYTQPSASELLPTYISRPDMAPTTAHQREPLSAIFEGTAYYGSQPTPELALAPVERTPEVVSPPPEAEVEAGEETKEVPSPDIDTIAREVYSDIKKRIKRERERQQGLA